MGSRNNMTLDFYNGYIQRMSAVKGETVFWRGRGRIFGDLYFHVTGLLECTYMYVGLGPCVCIVMV